MTANVEAVKAANARMVQDLTDLTGDKDHATVMVDIVDQMMKMSTEERKLFIRRAKSILQKKDA